MGECRVIEPGMLTTVQDLGRPGHASLGVCAGGAADALSLRVGNGLVGNDDGAPALEMTMTGAAVEFAEDALVALAGADAEATVASAGGIARAAPMWEAVAIRAGETLRIGRIGVAGWGVRAYVCVAGGFVVEPALGSASTHLGAGFGGYEGRALRAGDGLRLGAPGAGSGGRRARLTSGAMNTLREALTRRTLRATPGAQHERFAQAARESFWRAEFAVSSRSDRAGVRLSGAAVGSCEGGRMTSEGMPPGAVQVPASGEPIALLVDGPTTGGYPVIACIAGVDMPALGQARPGDRVRFELITPETARALAREVDRALGAGMGRA